MLVRWAVRQRAAPWQVSPNDALFFPGRRLAARPFRADLVVSCGERVIHPPEFPLPVFSPPSSPRVQRYLLASSDLQAGAAAALPRFRRSGPAKETKAALAGPGGLRERSSSGDLGCPVLRMAAPIFRLAREPFPGG